MFVEQLSEAGVVLDRHLLGVEFGIPGEVGWEEPDSDSVADMDAVGSNVTAAVLVEQRSDFGLGYPLVLTLGQTGSHSDQQMQNPVSADGRLELESFGPGLAAVAASAAAAVSSPAAEQPQWSCFLRDTSC